MAAVDRTETRVRGPDGNLYIVSAHGVLRVDEPASGETMAPVSAARAGTGGLGHEDYGAGRMAVDPGNGIEDYGAGRMAVDPGNGIEDYAAGRMAVDPGNGSVVS